MLVRRQGHTIKGASANVSAPDLQGVAFEMERAGEAEDLDRSASLMQKLNEEFERLREILGR